MPHIRNVSVARASVESKGFFDPSGVIFFQIWLTLAGFLISAISDTKD